MSPKPIAKDALEQGSEHLYHAYTADEDRERTNVHYEVPPEFFTLITGGEWNVYSCNLWDGAEDDTQSQEMKLDMMARFMELESGKRILDVGCGWAGPLVYLCQKYSVEGLGLTISPTQKQYAEQRIAKYGVDARVIDSHWQEFVSDEPFDAIYTDEVIVHFNDLGGFFKKCHSLLRPGGKMVNKELHLFNPRLAQLPRGAAFVNEIYGVTGNYRTLAEELKLANDAGFDVERVQHLEHDNYERTLDHWQSNQYANRERLIAAVGEEHYKNFRMYLRIARQVTRNMSLDVVVSRKFAA